MIKLVYFDNTCQFEEFINKLKQYKTKNYENDNKDFIFSYENSKLCICNFSKEILPNWSKKCMYKHQQNTPNDKKYYQLILYKYSDQILYLEICGNIKLFNKLLKLNYGIKKFNITARQLNIEQLNTEINKFTIADIVDDVLIQGGIRAYGEHLGILPNYYNEYSVNNIIEKYNHLISNRQLEQDDKLMSYNNTDCLDGRGKNSETVYNKLVCDTNVEKYINLDRRVINGCEIADIYNKQKFLLFHNKKAKDLRTLAVQIFNGALILKNPNICNQFMNCNNINSNFKYVFGIIKKQNEIIHFKDQLAIGNTCLILEKLGIEYYIDIINVIN